MNYEEDVKRRQIYEYSANNIYARPHSLRERLFAETLSSYLDSLSYAKQDERIRIGVFEVQRIRLEDRGARVSGRNTREVE